MNWKQVAATAWRRYWGWSTKTKVIVALVVIGAIGAAASGPQDDLAQEVSVPEPSPTKTQTEEPIPARCRDAIAEAAEVSSFRDTHEVYDSTMLECDSPSVWKRAVQANPTVRERLTDDLDGYIENRCEFSDSKDELKTEGFC